MPKVVHVVGSMLAALCSSSLVKSDACPVVATSSVDVSIRRAATSSPPSLLSRATKLPHTTWWSDWLSPHELLVAYGDKLKGFDFFRLDVSSGRKRPIRELDRAFRMWNHTHFACSPNGRFAAWRDYDGSLVVASLDGENYIHRWQDQADEHDPIIWMHDSRHWFVLNSDQHDRSGPTRMFLYDCLHPK